LYPAGINSIDFSPCNEAFSQNDSGSIEITMKEFSEFLIHIFEYWVENSAPSFKIRTIDKLITGIFNKEPLLLPYAAGTSCGLFATINNDGNIYICDNLDSESDRLIDNIKM
jgi:sulfatase maturation enzyme AslB (radical SAM superfamily)